MFKNNYKQDVVFFHNTSILFIPANVSPMRQGEKWKDVFNAHILLTIILVKWYNMEIMVLNEYH